MQCIRVSMDHEHRIQGAIEWNCVCIRRSYGNLTVPGYFTKLRLLWDEFDALVPPPAYFDDESHAQCNMIVADERQRATAGSRIGGDLNESMALYADRGKGTHHSNESMALYADRGRGTHYSNESMAMYTGRCGYTDDGSGTYPGKGSVNKLSGGNIDNIDKEQHVANTAMANTASAHIADKKVHLPNGQTTLVAHTGNCRLPTGDVLNNDLFNGKVKGTGKERGGLYYFPSHLSEKVRHVEQGLMAQTENSEGIVWQNRLGHPPVRVLKHFSLLKRFTDEEACNKFPVCPLYS
ncbi:hypothetical protein KY289_008020 [Solanum tuberosum]|nr:hypothetical protein KY289_008020 [Solanum tuberosum]